MTPFFSQNPLDRMDCLRSSIEEIFLTLAPSQIYFILMYEENIVLTCNQKYCFFTLQEMQELHIATSGAVFLGVSDNIYYFAKLIGNISIEQLKACDLRVFAMTHMVSDEQMSIVAQAASVLKWHAAHLFCGACGAQTNMAYGGWRRDCCACGKQHFPRIDPVVIMLVTCADYCLLGAGKKNIQQYSCLAGFMEPGETIEDAAKRELFEEAGVLGREVYYMFSQSWPFPSSLMIAVHMPVAEMKLKINTSELSDARWVHKADVAALLKGSKDHDFNLPPRIAIAHTMLEHWALT